MNHLLFIWPAFSFLASWATPRLFQGGYPGLPLLATPSPPLFRKVWAPILAAFFRFLSGQLFFARQFALGGLFCFLFLAPKTPTKWGEQTQPLFFLYIRLTFQDLPPLPLPLGFLFRFFRWFNKWTTGPSTVYGCFSHFYSDRVHMYTSTLFLFCPTGFFRNSFFELDPIYFSFARGRPVP